MNVSVRRALRRLAAPAAVAVAAAGLTAAASGVAAAATEPALRLVAATTTQTIVRAPEEPVYGIGLYAVAGRSPIEIRTKRAWAGTGVSAQLRKADGSWTKLPDGLTTDVNRLSNFFYVTATDSRGKVVAKQTSSFCPNSGEAARNRFDAPARSPFPEYCGYHPFTIASVFGIEQGWSVPAMGWDSDVYFDVPDGTYTIKASIQPAWRQALGVTLAQSKAELKVTVVTDEDYWEGMSAATHRAGGGHHHAAGTKSPKKLSPQSAARDAAMKKALGHRLTAAGKAPAAPVTRQAAAAFDGPKPDLRSLPAFGIQVDNTDDEGNPTRNSYLSFSATVWNAGPSPLVVDGFRRPGVGLMDAYQYFFDADGTQVGSSPAGTLEWDPREGHEHWHFTAFATYRLLNADKSKAIRSGKEAFCLVPTDPVDLTLPNANWKPASTDLTTACGGEGAMSIRETLDAGHGDTYGQYLPGQSFDITNVPSGTYYVEVRANPDDKLVEASTTNNVSLRQVVIGGTPGKQRTVRVPPYMGVDVP